MQYCAAEMQDSDTMVTTKTMIIVAIHGGIMSVAHALFQTPRLYYSMLKLPTMSAVLQIPYSHC